jgi:photosystem II stability/assembly factor-like uncharacterized protein
MTLDWTEAPLRPRDEPEPAARVPRTSLALPDGPPPVRRGVPPRAAVRAAAERAAGEAGLLPTAPSDLWVPAGPAVVMAGQAELGPRISGRARALKVSPDGQRAYVGTAQGGTWFTADAGESWLALDFYATTRDITGKLDESNALAIGALGVRFGAAPDGADDEVFVGTGEMRRQELEPLPTRMQGVGIRFARGPAPQIRAEGPTKDPWTLEATDLAGATVLRIMVDDRAGLAWAVTSKGLFRRPSGGGTSWTKVDTGLQAGLLSDMTITPGEAGEPRRIYVACIIPASAAAPLGSPALAWSSTGDDGTWKIIQLPAFPSSVEGAGNPPVELMLAKGNVPGRAVVYALGDHARMWRIEGDKAERVTGVPRKFAEKQAAYDLAIAVHPLTGAADQDRVVIGGSGVIGSGDTNWNAELYAGKVTRTGPGSWWFTRTYIGSGVHPDVHELAWVPGPGGNAPQLWVACDGGVFRSTEGGAHNSFSARNSGLASLEAQYLAQHPKTDALLYVGTQDNGMIRRSSAETWVVASQGDAGGTVVDPVDPRRVMTQYVRAEYYASADGGLTFKQVKLFRDPPASAGATLRKRYLDTQTAEKEGSANYASLAAADAGGTTRLVLGTDRVWLTADWGEHWVTLPSGLDPYAPSTPDAPNRTQDVLPGDGRVFALRWGTPDVLYSLSRDGVHRLAYSADTDKWTQETLYNRTTATFLAAGGATPPGQIPPGLPITDIAPHDKNRAPYGSLYATTSGVGGQHVWWYDGSGRWLPTGLLVDTPVHAVVVDPDHPEIVYVGGDVGVWKGEGTFPPAGSGDPIWTWGDKPYANGLPEAACIDLAVHAPTRLLRAALRGRGVWELALDGVEQGPEIYVRAHAHHTRRRPVPPEGTPDPLGDPTAPLALRLDASPDIRVYRAPGTDPPPPPMTLPLDATSNPFDLWVLQAARRAARARITVDGAWSAQSLAAMRPIPTTPEQWNAAVGGPNANRPPFDHDPPDAADIAVNLRDEPDRKAGVTASCVTGDGLLRIYVTVHARHWQPVPADHVAVFLLQTPFNGNSDLAGIPALADGWAGSVVADLTAAPAARGAWLSASPAWSYVDPPNPFRRPARPLEPNAPQVVMFEAVLASSATAWPPNGWLLLAAFHAPEDPLTTPQRPTTETNIRTLVRTKHHVAARSVRRAA